MSFDKINRRTHLYLGLLLIPWFLLYAVSGFVFNHPSRFTRSDPAAARWDFLGEHPYRLPTITEDNEDSLAQKLLRDQGLTGRYWTDTDEQGHFLVYRSRFLKTIRLTYDAQQSRLRIEERPLGMAAFLTSAHVRSGFDDPGLWDLLWAGLVDLVAVSILLWIASGLYLWWKLKRFRFWGWSALVAGWALFVWLALGV